MTTWLAWCDCGATEDAIGIMDVARFVAEHSHCAFVEIVRTEDMDRALEWLFAETELILADER